MEKTLGTSEIPRLRAPQSGVRYRYSTTGNQRIPSKAGSVVTGPKVLYADHNRRGKIVIRSTATNQINTYEISKTDSHWRDARCRPHGDCVFCKGTNTNHRHAWLARRDDYHQRETTPAARSEV